MILTDALIIKIIGWIITGLISSLIFLVKYIWSEHKKNEEAKWNFQQQKEATRDLTIEVKFNEITNIVKDLKNTFEIRNEVFFEEHNDLKNKVGDLYKRVDIHDLEIRELKLKK